MGSFAHRQSKELWRKKTDEQLIDFSEHQSAVYYAVTQK